MRKRYFILLVVSFYCITTFANSSNNAKSSPVVSQKRHMPNGFSGQTIYISNTDDTMLFVSSNKLPAEINMSVFDTKTVMWSTPVQIALSIDESKNISLKKSAGKELFISLKNKKGKLDLYSFYYNKGKCSSLQKLNDKINSEYNERNACLSDDGNTLYFSSDRKGGKGGYDIYKSERMENGDWGTAQNLGDAINTKSDEDSPFMLSDNATLYFSSEAHGSTGGFDIFNSTLSEEGAWSTPENVGTSINSKGDELYFYLTDDEKLLFYSSSNNISQTEFTIFEFINYQQEFTVVNQ